MFSRCCSAMVAVAEQSSFFLPRGKFGDVVAAYFFKVAACGCDERVEGLNSCVQCVADRSSPAVGDLPAVIADRFLRGFRDLSDCGDECEAAVGVLTVCWSAGCFVEYGRVDTGFVADGGDVPADVTCFRELLVVVCVEQFGGFSCQAEGCVREVGASVRIDGSSCGKSCVLGPVVQRVALSGHGKDGVCLLHERTAPVRSVALGCARRYGLSGFVAFLKAAVAWRSLCGFGEPVKCFWA